MPDGKNGGEEPVGTPRSSPEAYKGRGTESGNRFVGWGVELTMILSGGTREKRFS